MHSAQSVNSSFAVLILTVLIHSLMPIISQDLVRDGQKNRQTDKITLPLHAHAHRVIIHMIKSIILHL